MYCPNCGTPNTAQAEKCVNCGKPLPKLSPSGEPLPVGQEGQNPASRPADWPGTNPNPGPGGYYQPGQPGSQYSYRPESTAPNYIPGGPIGTYGQNNYPPYYSYTTPADRVGVAGTDAGFWPRLGAYLIDSIIVGILLSIVTGIPLVIWFVNLFSKYQDQLLPVCDSTALQYDKAACNSAIQNVMINRGELGATIGLFFGVFLVGLLIYVLYYTLQTARGSTVGKRVFGLRVVTEDGNVPGFGRALLRHTIGYFVSNMFFGLGFLWIAFDPQHQGWHDKIAGTYVIRAQ